MRLFEKKFLSVLDMEEKELLETIESKKELSDELKKKLADTLEKFKDTFKTEI